MLGERRVEDLLLDVLVDRQVLEELGPFLLAGLDAALGRLLELGHELLGLLVVGLQQGEGIHTPCPPSWFDPLRASRLPTLSVR
jgi:hypothetical protein